MRWSMKREAASPALVPSDASLRERSLDTNALWVASSGRSVTFLNPAAKTLAAASGSAQMLNSADGVILPLWWAPPMMMSSGTRSTSLG